MSWTRQNNAATLSHNRYVLALAHLCTAVLYVIDASEQCGHTVAQQVRVSVSSSVYGRAVCHGRVRTMRPHNRYVLALAHLRTAVLYDMDASEQCGHTVAQQVWGMQKQVST